MQNSIIKQGESIYIYPEEEEILYKILNTNNIKISNFNSNQKILTLPQKYIGIIGFPQRTIIIKPKEDELTLNHILRLYYFIYSFSNADLNIPLFNIDGTQGNLLNVVDLFLEELIKIVHKGLPLSYKELENNMSYARGHINIVKTKRNILLDQPDVFHCNYDTLSMDTEINRVFAAALK